MRQYGIVAVDDIDTAYVGVPHTAFKDPRNSDSNSTQLRESIEARVFVYFD